MNFGFGFSFAGYLKFAFMGYYVFSMLQDNTEDAIKFLEELFNVTYDSMDQIDGSLPEDMINTQDYVKYLFEVRQKVILLKILNESNSYICKIINNGIFIIYKYYMSINKYKCDFMSVL